ncbi:hypothetical protein AciPR4_2998 [Terriglobus saanensis SP1PR4]|uniref:Uncharacterized protein n=2 Tax=Terriglobus saanensis TaxID=870903 RepID=E8V571_TERSS|nr:hypothetical protein AciPR4_2998 [Terriglobus saanensis SP1PR4]
MEGTLSDLNGLCNSKFLEKISPSLVARARLQQQLNAQEKPARWWRRSLSGGLLPASMAVATLLMVIGVAVYGERRLARDKSTGSQDAKSQSIPNRLLTPGAIRPVTLSEICSSTDEDLDPTVPASTQNAVLEEYGVPRGRAGKNYQIDYLVNPQLGGTNDIKNLWPEPEHEGVWNARAKDELEKHLHQMVCDRTVDLTVAQREIATDWIAAYRKYVRRQTPA